MSYLDGSDSRLVGAREAFDEVSAERNALERERLKANEEILRLKNDLARRDRILHEIGKTIVEFKAKVAEECDRLVVRCRRAVGVE